MKVSVPRVWPNETVVILATGPSLTQDDVDYCRGKARAIAINDAHRLAPWADALYSSDRQWWPKHRGVPSFEGLKYSVGSRTGYSNPFSHLPDIQVLENTGFTGLELSPTGLRTSQNSGYAAINLAVHLGASRIVLLGYDMSRRGGQVHFFGNHVGMPNPTDAQFVSWRAHFNSLVQPLAALGVQIVNCAPGSALTAFPTGRLRDVLVSPEAAA